MVNIKFTPAGLFDRIEEETRPNKKEAYIREYSITST